MTGVVGYVAYAEYERLHTQFCSHVGGAMCLYVGNLGSHLSQYVTYRMGFLCHLREVPVIIISNLSYDRSTASSTTIPPLNAI
jgi:hypothetical protein